MLNSNLPSLPLHSGCLALVASLAVACGTAMPSPQQAAVQVAADVPAVAKSPPVDVTLVHLSDTEAGTLANDAVGGIARAEAMIRALRRRSPTSLVLHGGDSLIPSPELSLELGGQSVVVEGNARMHAAAFAIGNHEFDEGEAFLARAISQTPAPYLSATIEVLSGPLRPLVAAPRRQTPWAHEVNGQIAPRVKVCAGVLEADRCNGAVVGVVAATTEQLRVLSKGASGSLRVPKDRAALIALISAQVAALEAEGIHIIVLLSHMQGLHNDVTLLAGGLVGVDVIVSAGGEHRLAQPGQRLLLGDERDAWCDTSTACYPIMKTAKDGAPVALVSTSGGLSYVGDLRLSFDGAGRISHVDEGSRPWPIDDQSVAELQASLDPDTVAFEGRARDALRPLLKEIVHEAPYLEGERELVRNVETNLGDLSADAMLKAARASVPSSQAPTFAMRNAGGIRASIGKETQGGKEGGPVRVADLKNAFRFDTRVVVANVTHQQLAETLEASLVQVGTGRGHFPQVSDGVRLVYAAEAPELVPRTLDGRVIGVRCAGRRVRDLVVPGAHGSVVVVKEGVVLTPAATLRLATLEYLTGGGDGWFPGQAPRIVTLFDGNSDVPLTEQLALRRMLEAADFDPSRYSERTPTTRISRVSLKSPLTTVCEK